MQNAVERNIIKGSVAFYLAHLIAVLFDSLLVVRPIEMRALFSADRERNF